MNTITKSLILFIIFILPSHLFALEKDTIIWVESDFPPVWIFKGPDKGTGGADLLQKLLEKKLSGYNHRRVKANNSRLQNMMKNGENACACAKFKTTDREKIMYFNTVPSSFILSNGIITKKSKRHLFSNSQKISLADTLQNQNLRLGLSKKRKYSGQIDQILERFKDNSNIHREAKLAASKVLVHKLLFDRVDYILGYDWEIQYQIRHSLSAEDANKFIFLPILETKEEYRSMWEQWMSNKVLYRKLYREVFLKDFQ